MKTSDEYANHDFDLLTYKNTSPSERRTRYNWELDVFVPRLKSSEISIVQKHGNLVALLTSTSCTKARLNK